MTFTGRLQAVLVLEIANLVKRYGERTAVAARRSRRRRRARSSACSAPTAPARRRRSRWRAASSRRRSGSVTIGGHDLATRTDRGEAADRPRAAGPRALRGAVAAPEPRVLRRALRAVGRARSPSASATRSTIAELADRADDLVKKFSGGMKRRLNIAAGPAPRADAARPRRADGRRRSAEPPPHLRRDPRAPRSRHDDRLHEPLHGRGRGAVRSRRDHGRRRDRRARHARRAVARTHGRRRARVAATSRPQRAGDGARA